MMAKDEATRAFKEFCEAHKREPTDELRFAYTMGWYEGRIAFCDQYTKETLDEIDDVFGDSHVRR